MFNKIKFVLFILAGIMLISSGAVACSSDAETDGGDGGNSGEYSVTPDKYFNFELNEGGTYEISVKDKYDLPVIIVIPDAHEGKAVTKIKKGTFSVCDKITDIIIPNSVTEIGDSAFFGCSSLKNVVLPSGLKKLDKYTFSGCRALKNISLPSELENLEDEVFRGCASLTEITLPNSLIKIGDWCFYGCSAIAGITVPSKVVYIGSHAFADCASLKNITVESANTAYKSVDGNLYSKDGTVFLQYAAGKESETFNLPNEVTVVGGYSFYKSVNLATINLTNNVTYIGAGAFYGCAKLSTFQIPSSISQIADSTFWACSSIKNISIPSSVNYIGYCAFSSCSGLENVNFETKSGWKVCSHEGESKTLDTLNNGETAKNFLTQTYVNYYWNR